MDWSNRIIEASQKEYQGKSNTSKGVLWQKDKSSGCVKVYMPCHMKTRKRWHHHIILELLRCILTAWWSDLSTDQMIQVSNSAWIETRCVLIRIQAAKKASNLKENAKYSYNLRKRKHEDMLWTKLPEMWKEFYSCTLAWRVVIVNATFVAPCYLCYPYSLSNLVPRSALRSILTYVC